MAFGWGEASRCCFRVDDEVRVEQDTEDTGRFRLSASVFADEESFEDGLVHVSTSLFQGGEICGVAVAQKLEASRQGYFDPLEGHLVRREQALSGGDLRADPLLLCFLQ